MVLGGGTSYLLDGRDGIVLLRVFDGGFGLGWGGDFDAEGGRVVIVVVVVVSIDVDAGIVAVVADLVSTGIPCPLAGLMGVVFRSAFGLESEGRFLCIYSPRLSFAFYWLLYRGRYPFSPFGASATYFWFWIGTFPVIENGSVVLVLKLSFLLTDLNASLIAIEKKRCKK